MPEQATSTAATQATTTQTPTQTAPQQTASAKTTAPTTPTAAPDKKASEVEQPKAPDKLSASWEKIQKLEAKHQSESARLKAERDAFARDREAFAKQQAEIEAYQKLMQENPVEWFEKHAPKNLFEDVARRYVNQGKPSQEEIDRKHREELQSLRAELEEFRKTTAEKELTERVMAYQSNLEAELAKPDYELIKAFGAQQEIIDLVVSWKAEHGELLTPARAAGMIENELQEQLKRVGGTSKARTLLQSLIAQPEQPTTPSEPDTTAGSPDTAQQPAAQKQTTLTKELTSAAPVQSRRAKSREAKLKEAAARLAPKPR